MNKFWFENSDFWDLLYSLFFAENRADPCSDTEHLIQLTGISPPAEVLDIACGSGRHSIPFARRGFKVTGIDITESYLHRAENFAVESGENIEFIRSDMLHFSRQSAFDLIIVLYSSFGFFAEQNDDSKFLENMFDSLNRNGQLILDLKNREYVRDNFIAESNMNIDGITYSEFREVEGNFDLIHTTWTIQSSEFSKTFRTSIRLYDAETVQILLNDAGFGCCTLYSSFKGDLFEKKSPRICAAAGKGKSIGPFRI
ncbi:MAG TPA: class I SAM-dependent methyltransferase [Leptospiraceae bacterium]|nr:class I SAM-dependent methyltransferase [Leptospiraceae bacterium]HNI99757.1 class I SAM-dependent methyltransferase [Leptospiraceae bacterium]HNM03455.1 class I SAM-dependent methyltransferase [Leptospiraceae bacterium]